PDAIIMTKKILEYLVDNYTHESGVRELDKTMAKIVRVIARKVAMDETYNKRLSEKDLEEILGAPKYVKDKYQGNEFAGVVTGLAWTAVGGEILFVETSLSKGKGNLTLTGNLGDVMKESAVIALEYIKSHSDMLDLPADIFENWNVHVHVPEGAIPKDGPSAGVTMATSIASAMTQRKVKEHLAMTGEITLRGKVLPVGGIKEKILAAKRANITEIILSEENRKDIKEINEIYLKGLHFHFVKNVMQVFENALLRERVDKPINISR
ncbi:MAG TPA: S16 family serine protease, partial [Bacteroidales bacterium]|nr:S16 family serine protease [Bacteroidales bacterium]